MSDAGDDIDQVEEPVVSEAPKGKMGVEDALQVCGLRVVLCHQSRLTRMSLTASAEERTRTQRTCPWSA